MNKAGSPFVHKFGSRQMGVSLVKGMARALTGNYVRGMGQRATPSCDSQPVLTSNQNLRDDTSISYSCQSSSPNLAGLGRGKAPLFQLGIRWAESWPTI